MKKILLFLINAGLYNRGAGGQRDKKKNPTTDLLEVKNIPLLKKGSQINEIIFNLLVFHARPDPNARCCWGPEPPPAPFVSFEEGSKTTDIQSHYFGTMICCLRL